METAQNCYLGEYLLLSWSLKTQDTILYQGLPPSLVTSLGAFVTFLSLFL